MIGYIMTVKLWLDWYWATHLQVSWEKPWRVDLNWESIYINKNYALQKPTLWAWRQGLGRWIWNWQGQWAPGAPWARRVTRSWLVRLAAAWCGRPCSWSHSGCLQVLFMSSRLVFTLSIGGCLKWVLSVEVQQAKFSIQDACGCCLCPCSSGPRTMTKMVSDRT